VRAVLDSTSGEGPDLKQRAIESPLDRVLRALNHPVRRRILRALVDGRGSASTLSRELRLNLGIVSYHLNQVLARECDIVELVESVPRRGAVEKFYRLKFHALSGGDPAGADGNGSPRSMSLEECFIVAVAAMDANALQALEGSTWNWSLNQVDGEAWGEICAAGEDFDRRARAAAAGSGERVEGEAPHHVVVGVAAFPAVSPPPAS
jgi:DNA-binding transcriptional ArsR family regulator